MSDEKDPAGGSKPGPGEGPKPGPAEGREPRPAEGLEPRPTEGLESVQAEAPASAMVPATAMVPASLPRSEGEAASASEQERMDLPKWNRARVKRKAPAGQPQDDAFQGTVRRAGRGAVAKAPFVLGGIVVLAAAIAGGVWLTRRNREDQATSTRILATGLDYEVRGLVANVEEVMGDRKRAPTRPLAKDEAELEQKVNAALAELADEAPESAANRLADLVRASELVEAGKFAEAEPLYRSYLEEHNVAPSLAFLAREGLANALAGQGNIDGALAELDTLAGEEGDFYRDQALWEKARLLERQDRKDEAIEVYKQYATEYPLDKTSFAQLQVRGRLEELAPDALPKDLPPSLPEGLIAP